MAIFYQHGVELLLNFIKINGICENKFTHSNIVKCANRVNKYIHKYKMYCMQAHCILYTARLVLKYLLAIDNLIPIYRPIKTVGNGYYQD